MRYGIAIWNYAEPGQPLPDLVSEFAAMGFTAISFIQRQITELSDREADDLRALLEARDLVATVHGGPRVSSEQVRSIGERLGGLLRSFTIDALMRFDSRGEFYDVPPMAAVLAEAGLDSRPVSVAIEDFPLDEEAAVFYNKDLAPLLENPNYGILVDLGHMNLRSRRDNSSFRGMSPLQYLSGIPLSIVEVHIHDNLGDKDSHGHIGFGNLDFPEAVRALKAVGFSGISTVEVAPSFHGSTPKESKPRARESLEVWRGLWESDRLGGR